MIYIKCVWDWADSLNILLIFVSSALAAFAFIRSLQGALYSAVLESIIIEIIDIIQRTQMDTTRIILLVISWQPANSSYPPYHQTPFVASVWKVKPTTTTLIIFETYWLLSRPSTFFGKLAMV